MAPSRSGSLAMPFSMFHTSSFEVRRSASVLFRLEIDVGHGKVVGVADDGGDAAIFFDDHGAGKRRGWLVMTKRVTNDDMETDESQVKGCEPQNNANIRLPKTECRGFSVCCGPNILDAASELRPREVAIVIAIIVALRVVAAIVLL
jgi:hypothetical protein